MGQTSNQKVIACYHLDTSDVIRISFASKFQSINSKEKVVAALGVDCRFSATLKR